MFVERYSYMALVKFFLFLLPFHLLLLKAKSECPESFQCGNFTMEFPLTKSDNPGCGLITVENCDPDDPNPIIRLGGRGMGYTIMEKISTTKFLLLDHLLQAQLNNRSCFSYEVLTQLQTPSLSFAFSPNLTLYPCLNESGNRPTLDDLFHNYSSIDCGIYFAYYKSSTTVAPILGGNDIPDQCQLVQLPSKSSQDSDDLFSMISFEYALQWNVSEACLNCFYGGGQCLTDNNNQFYCKKGDVFLV